LAAAAARKVCFEEPTGKGAVAVRREQEDVVAAGRQLAGEVKVHEDVGALAEWVEQQAARPLLLLRRSGGGRRCCCCCYCCRGGGEEEEEEGEE
jgi:hypothetical protein